MTGEQMIRTVLTGLCVLALCACAAPGTPFGGLTGGQMRGQADIEKGPKDIDGYSLKDEIVMRSEPGPPSTVPGECWIHTTLPAVIETVTQHNETAPGVFQSVSTQQILQNQRRVWFRTPCPAQMTPDFIASLQRALKARGLFTAPLTGVMDPPTKAAVRRYQSALGLDSDQLSLGAARQLGLAAYSLWDLTHNDD